MPDTPLIIEESDNTILYMASPPRILTVTEAARAFADVVNRAFYRHETTVLMRSGVAVAHIAPVAPVGISASELAHRWALLPRLTADDAEAWERERPASGGKRPVPPSPWE